MNLGLMKRRHTVEYSSKYLMTAESNPEVFALCLAARWCAADGMTYEDAAKVTSIGAQAFRSCTKLEYIDIKSNVTSMGNYVFHTCSSLKNVYIHATTPPTAGTSIFINVPTGTLNVYVPSESVDLYKSAENWARYASCIKAIPT